MLALLLDIFIKGSVILLLAAALTRLMRHRSAAARHLVWGVALFSAAALPLASGLLPAWTVRLPAGTALENPVVVEPLQTNEASSSVASSSRPTVRPSGPSESSVRPPESSADSPVRPAAPASALLIAWAVVAVSLLARLLLGLFRLSRLTRHAEPVQDSEWLAHLDDAARTLGLTRAVRLLRSDRIAVPLTWGVFRPALLLPADCDEWSTERRRAVLIHELAHAARWDFATQLGAELCGALYWFNPLTWVALRALRAERERACDDRVLATGTRASAYAAELLELAQQALLPEPPRVALAMARRSELEGRLLAILNPRLSRGAPRARAAVFLAALALAITLPLSALQVDRTPKPAPPQPPTRAPAVPSAPRMTPPPAARGAVPMAPSPREPTIGAPSVPATLPMTPAAPSIASRAIPMAPTAPPPPSAPAAISCDRSKGSSSISNTSHNGRRSWKASWTGDGCSVDLVAQGEVKFNADFTDIAEISSGGYLEVTVREPGGTRRVELRPQGDGLRRVYLVDGNPAPWDAAARAWFADFLIALDRQTGFAVEVRFPALLRQGVNAVFGEIDQLASDYVRGIWYRKLLTAASLSSAEVRRVARGAGTTMESDYELGRVLAALGAKYSLADPEVRDAFIDAAGTLESDYERAQLLLVVIKGPVTPEAGRTIVKLTGAMSSDYEKARVLLALGGSAQMDMRTATPDYLDVVVGMESDYERGRVLKFILGSGQLSKESLMRVLGVVSHMDSDYEAASVLVALATKNQLDDAVRAAYLKAADNLSSDYESQRARSALRRAQD